MAVLGRPDGETVTIHHRAATVCFTTDPRDLSSTPRVRHLLTQTLGEHRSTHPGLGPEPGHPHHSLPREVAPGGRRDRLEMHSLDLLREDDSLVRKPDRINGDKLRADLFDHGYSPPKPVEKTRKLVPQDEVRSPSIPSPR